jgi:hypothetical protein
VNNKRIKLLNLLQNNKDLIDNLIINVQALDENNKNILMKKINKQIDINNLNNKHIKKLLQYL